MIKVDIHCTNCDEKIDELTFDKKYDGQVAAMLVPDAKHAHKAEKNCFGKAWREKNRREINE